MDARISVDGQAREVKDICIEDLLAVVDEAEKMIPKRRQRSSPSRLRAASELRFFFLLMFGDLFDGDPLVVEGLSHGLAPRADLHLVVGVVEVALDGPLRQVDPAGYLAIGEPAGSEEQDLQLPGGDDALGPSLGLLEQLARHPHHHVAFPRVEHRGAHRAMRWIEEELFKT
jgi:hypothetical protein